MQQSGLCLIHGLIGSATVEWQGPCTACKPFKYKETKSKTDGPMSIRILRLIVGSLREVPQALSCPTVQGVHAR